MGILGDIAAVGSVITGNSAAKKANKLSKAQLEFQKKQAEKSNAVGDYLFQLAQSLQNRQSGLIDAYGGGVQYNPVTGQYEIILSPEERGIQDASYREELARNTEDQAIRRAGLRDAERIRQQASGESDQALRDLAAFRSGVGQVDASKLAAQMRANRLAAVNAGYDDAARAASRIGLRTGTAAGDTLSEIARNRTRDIMSVGDPTLDALSAAEQINNNRLSTKANLFQMFGGQASNIADAGFTPSGYNQQGIANKFSTEANDLNWKDLLGSYAGSAAGAYGSAAGNMNNATRNFNSTYNNAGSASLIKGLGNLADSSGLGDILTGIFKGKGGSTGGGGGDWDYSVLASLGG